MTGRLAWRFPLRSHRSPLFPRHASAPSRAGRSRRLCIAATTARRKAEASGRRRSAHAAGPIGVAVLLLSAARFVVTDPVLADEDEGPAVSGALSWVSDYRFRGLSLNGKDFALQGELGASWQGWHVSGWASSQRAVPGADVETDVTIGRSFDWLGLDWDLGGIVYLFPGSRGSVYGEFYAAAGRGYGPFDWTARVHYVPAQPNSNDKDNIYLAGDLGYALPALADGAIALAWTGHVGFEDGAFAADKWDFETGLSASYRAFRISLGYVASVNGGPLGDDAVILRIGAAF